MGDNNAPKRRNIFFKMKLIKDIMEVYYLQTFVKFLTLLHTIIFPSICCLTTPLVNETGLSK